MKKLLLLSLLFCLPAYGATVHVDYHSSTVLHQSLSGSYVAGDQIGTSKVIESIAPKGGVVILEGVAVIDENEQTAATTHHFFDRDPGEGADSSAVALTLQEGYLGSFTGNSPVDLGSFAAGYTGGSNSTITLKLKNNSTGLTVIHETRGAPAYNTGKTKFRYYFRNQ